MKSFNQMVFFLLTFLLAGLGSKAALSTSPPSDSDSDFQGMGHPSVMSPGTNENSTGDWPNPEFPGTSPQPHSLGFMRPTGMPHAVSPENISLDDSETPSPVVLETTHQSSPGNPPADPAVTSATQSPDIPSTNSSKAIHPEPCETPKPELPETPHLGSPENPTPNASNASPPKFPEATNTDPRQTTPHESREMLGLNSTGINPVKTPETPNPSPTKPFDPESIETHVSNTSEPPNSELPPNIHPDPTEAPDPGSRVTQNPSPSEIPQTETTTTPHHEATQSPTPSDPELPASLRLETSVPFKEATALGELHLSLKPEMPVTTQPDSSRSPTSTSPGIGEMKVSQNSNPKGLETPPPSARIVGPPVPPGSPTQMATATPRAPQRRSRGERVNTIIVVERVKETGVTLVGRSRGASGGALCFFFAGTGLLICIFLLLWCLYRRAAQHRPFAHHRLPDSGDEPVMHLNAPKDPYDLYFYAPDAWIPSHIATKQPPPTPPLPPKLPPPPRGGQPQRLEALSPATLQNNFV